MVETQTLPSGIQVNIHVPLIKFKSILLKRANIIGMQHRVSHVLDFVIVLKVSPLVLYQVVLRIYFEHEVRVDAQRLLRLNG